MPLRFLMYLVKLYEAYVVVRNIDLYSETKQRIPRPQCVCFYNGVDDKEDRGILKLSGMYFEDPDKIDNKTNLIVELEVEMININYGHNKELLEKCKPLFEYSFFVDRIRYHVNDFKKTGEEYTLEDAIEKAIKDLPEEFEILEFILKNREEVKAMCLFEYDEEWHIKHERAEAKKEGREEGRKEERMRLLIELVKEGTYTVEQASKKANMTEEEFKKILGKKIR